MTDITEKQLFKLFMRDGNSPEQSVKLAREAMAVRGAQQRDGKPPMAPSEENVAAQLADRGVPADRLNDATAEAMRTRGGMVELPPTADEGASKVQSVISGATIGFDDEIAGGIAAAKHAISGPNISDTVAGRKTAGDAYRSARDERREIKRVAREANPKTFMAGEVAGAIAAAPITGAVNTARQAAIAGAKYGAALGLGNSEADLTRGEVGGAVADTAIGATIGGVLGPVAHGVTQGIGAAARAGGQAAANLAKRAVGAQVPSPVQQAAGTIAKDIAANADQPSLIGKNNTVRTATEKAQVLIKEWSDMLGKPFRLPPSQVSGDAAAALAESRAGNFPVTMQKAQVEVADKLRNVAQLTDMYVKRMAANPSLIGKGGVGDTFGNVLKEQTKALYDMRRMATKPLYDQVEKLGGGVDAAPIQQTIRDILDRNGLNESQVAGLLGRVLKGTESRAAGGGLSINEANSLRQLMGQTRQRLASAFGPLDMGVQGKMAGEVITAVDAAFDAAEQQASGPAIRALRQANALWKSHSEAIERSVTDAVDLITQRAGGELGETIPQRMLKMEPRQVAGLFRMAEADPAAVANMRAELVFEKLSKAVGARAEDAPIAAAQGVSKFSPAKAQSALAEIEPILRATYPDAKTNLAISRMYDLFQRTSFGPNIRGSNTASQLADVMKEGAEKAAERAVSAVSPTAGFAVSTLKKALEKVTGTAEPLATAVATPEGITAINNALAALLKAQKGAVSPQLIREALAGLSRAGAIGTTEQATTAAVEFRGAKPRVSPAEVIDPEEPAQRIAREPYQ